MDYGNHEYKGIRNEIELVIKEFGLDRSRVSEVSKIAYASILRNVEKSLSCMEGSSTGQIWAGLPAAAIVRDKRYK